MPHALQIINAFKQGLAGGSFEALTPGTGDSFTFQNVPQGSQAYLSEIWAVDDASPMEISLTASRFHDQQFGIRAAVVDGSTLAPVNRSVCVSPAGLDQRIFPSDVLSVRVNGTKADNVNVTFLLYYADLPGISARLATWDFVRGNMKNLVGINTPLTSGTGDWGTPVALNASDNRLHANQDYAVVGFTSDVPLSAVAISGIDTGNLKTGGPVVGDPDHDAWLFADLARKYNAGLIPIINSNNAGAIQVVAADTQGASANIDVQMVELTGQFGG